MFCCLVKTTSIVIAMGEGKGPRLIYRDVVIPFSISSSWSMNGLLCGKFTCVQAKTGRGIKLVGKRARVPEGKISWYGIWVTAQETRTCSNIPSHSS
jgi:hypothetical protein